MSDIVSISLRSSLEFRLEVEGLTADCCGVLSERDIAALPVWQGNRRASLGDFFDVRGSRSAHVQLEGDLTGVDGIGAGMTGGELIVRGHAGRRVAAGMTSGRVEIHGDVGDDAGAALAGGILRVTGHAGDRLGASSPGASKGMTGGEILVDGSAGRETAARTRRGLVAVAGDVGEDAGRAMIAGTLVVLGRTGSGPGRGSKRGSLIAAGEIAVPTTYRYACIYEPPHVRLLMTYLQRSHGFAVDPRAITGRYTRYCGDLGDPGKGEILVLCA